MEQESQRARELRILKNIVFALPRAARWFGQSFMGGIRAGMANAQQEHERKDRERD
jgi:hypothetical protein